MIPITAGMTPTEFIAAMNSNYGNIKLATLYDTSAVDVLDATSAVTVIDDNFKDIIPDSVPLPSTDDIEAGLKGPSFISSLNSNFTRWDADGITLETCEVVGDGITDDFAALQNYVNAKQTPVIGTTRADEYLISQPINLASNKSYVINGTIKIQDGETVDITADSLVGAHTVEVADPSKFHVGQWVSVTDDNKTVYRESLVAWTGLITDITGDVLTLEGTAHGNFTVAANGRCGHSQGCIIIQDKENINVTGIGLLDGNRYNQIQVICSTGLDLHNFWEHNRAGATCAIWHSENVIWDGVDCKDGLVHTMAICSPNLVPEVPTRNKNITVSNCNINTGHDKCILVRFTEDSTFENITCDGMDGGNIKTWEDGLIFYSDAYNITVNNFTAKNVGRNGFSWNSEDGDYLTADGITTENCGTFNGAGVDINCTNATLSNLVLGDSIRIGSAYTTNNILINNIEIESNLTLPFDHILMLYGQDITINNLTIKNSVSKIGEAAIDISAAASNVVINGTSITNHTGIMITETSYSRATWNNFTGLIIT